VTDQQVDLPTACPRCGEALVSEYGTTPWCGACEWNLDTFSDLRGSWRWRWLDRIDRRTAYRLSKRQYAELAGRPVGRRGGGAVRALLIALAVVLLALVLRPRVHRLDEDAVVLSRDEAPTLFRLIDEVAAASDAPRPHVVAVDISVNAYTALSGLRHRRVLCLGLPLWAVLGPQERVALLGHELGHFINGDVRTGVITRIPDTVLVGLIDALTPGWARSTRRTESMIFEAVAGVVLAMLRSVVTLVRTLLRIVLLRNGQRAEYLADQISARCAGSGAAVALADELLGAEAIGMLVRRESRAGGLADRWRSAVAEATADRASRLPRLRQLSVREEASLFASHPPPGLRASMLASRPHESAQVVLSQNDSDRIDEELAPHYQRTRRDLASV
jgi:heat shock protein HtpX